MRVAELYLKEFGRIAKAGNTVLLPADAGNPAAMVAQGAAAMGATADALPGGIGGGSGGTRRIVAGDESFIRTVTGGDAGAPGAEAGETSAEDDARALAAENLRAAAKRALDAEGGVLRGRGEKRNRRSDDPELRRWRWRRWTRSTLFGLTPRSSVLGVRGESRRSPERYPRRSVR